MLKQKELQAAYIGEYGWHPWTNTIAYRPLTATTTVNDQSGNNYNLTNAWQATWETVDWVSCMYCNGNVSWTWYVYTTALTTPPTSITINIWSKASNDWSWTYARWLFDTNYNYSPQGNNWIRWEFYSWNGYPAIIVGNGWAGTPWTFNQLNYTWVNYSAIQSWTLWTVTYNWTTKEVNIYRNWTLATTKTITSYIPTTWWTDNLTLWVGWRDNSTNRRWKWWISETILENKSRTAEEILNYYNSTKWTYWL